MSVRVRIAQWLAILLLAAVALSGCAPFGAASTSDSISISPAQSPPDPGESPEPAEQMRYVCIEGHASFTIEEIEVAPAADARADPAWDLLQSLLEEQASVEESDLPPDGWLRVVDSPEQVVFLAPIPVVERPYAAVHLVPGGGYLAQDGWGVDSFGSCLPRIDVPDDVSVASWWVDPLAEAIGPDSEIVPTLVLEHACASGKTAEGRILPPTIVYGRTQVTISVVVRSLGAAECPGHPPTPYTIQLAEPLGDRALVDGGSFPPGDPLEVPEH